MSGRTKRGVERGLHRQIEVRDYGHQVDSPCMWRIMKALIASASVREWDVGCTADIRRPPFATSIPAAMALK